MADVSAIPKQVYESVSADLGEPPGWLDATFILIISIIHIVYSFKFTKFSLAYLNAKCEEKKSRKRWTAIQLYLKAIKSDLINPNIDDADYRIYTLWTQLSIVRNILRISMFLSCFVVLILFIVLVFNIMFEYLTTCIINYKKGAPFALIAFPALLFIIKAIIQYIFYGILASWSINVDNIADGIAYEQQHKRAKLFAFKDTKWSIPDTPISVPWDEEDEEDEEYHLDDLESIPDDINTPRKSVMERYRQKMMSFTGPYWMAVHWRLLIVSCCIIATIIALPVIRSQEAEEKDSFWLQLFLRYLCIATALWLNIYFILSLGIGLYGRVSTLSVYGDIIKDSDDTEPKYNRLRNNLLRFCCLMDAFGLKDTNKLWSKCRFILLTVIVISGIICICIWPITEYQYGLLWFVGVVHILYYFANIILTVKPRGLYYLWKSDMIALEMGHDFYSENIQQNEEEAGAPNISLHDAISSSHAANMTHFRVHQIRRILSRPFAQDVIMEEFSTGNLLDVDDDDDDEEEELDDNQHKHISVQSEAEALMIKNDNEEERKMENEKRVQFDISIIGDDVENEQNDILQNEEEVITLFNRLYLDVNDKRKQSITEHTFNPFVRFKMNIYSVIKQYKGYWLLILPYNYNIRPLSVLPHGRSVTETFIKKKSFKRGCKMCWNGCYGFVCCALCILMLLLALYLSVAVNGMLSDNTNKINNIMYIDDNIRNGSNVTMTENKISSYPICELKFNANLSVIDLTMLSHMTYDIKFNEEQFGYTIQDVVCAYFDRKLPKNAANGSDCSWKVIYYTRSEPVFMHLRHSGNNTDVIAIRGTLTALDFIQDANLFQSVALLQLASWIVPITSIFPTSFIIRIVYFMSYFEGHIDNGLRERYDYPVFNYAYNLLLNTNYKINSLYFIGHSLGGGVSQAVAAQINQLYEVDWIQQHAKHPNLLSNLDIKSYSVATPGMVYNSKKFSIGIHDLFVTATILKPKSDAVSNIDIVGGMVQNQQCYAKQFYSCHRFEAIFCGLVKDCNIYDSHNPDLIAVGCTDWAKNGEGSFMKYLNQTY